MTSGTTTPKRVTYLARECQVRVEADHGSGLVRINVDGREAELGTGSALRVAAKLREAAERADMS